MLIVNGKNIKVVSAKIARGTCHGRHWAWTW